MLFKSSLKYWRRPKGCLGIGKERHLFSKIMLNNKYLVREEDERILFFSGYDRALHFISKDAFALIELAQENSFEDLIEMHMKKFLDEDRNDIVDKLEKFFIKLKNNNVIFFLN